MSNDLTDFEEKLGEELRMAAYRRLENRASKASIRRPALSGALAAVAVFVLIGLAVLVPTVARPQQAFSSPFEPIILEDEIRLKVVDVIKDPRATEQQLYEELGIVIRFLPEPVPPALVNDVIGGILYDRSTYDFETDDEGRVKTVILSKEVPGHVTIYYGRAANPGERYIATKTSVICKDFWAQTPQESAQRISKIAETVRYDTMDAAYNYHSGIPFDEIDPNYRLIDISYMSDREVIVIYSAHLDALGRERRNCGWSAEQKATTTSR